MEHLNIREALRHVNLPGKSLNKLDILALVVNDFRRHGYFIEIGAMDGVQYSNTYLLEKQFQWSGIVVEPAHCWHKDLYVNRNCRKDYRAVAAVTGQKLWFIETDPPELSGLQDFWTSKHPHHSFVSLIKKNHDYPVSTVSLNDLLIHHKSPANIDYVSIDTEGSELCILQYFDFTGYKINLWTLEHNFVSTTRQNIFDIMHSNGYKRICPDLSGCDDWYVPLTIS